MTRVVMAQIDYAVSSLRGMAWINSTDFRKTHRVCTIDGTVRPLDCSRMHSSNSSLNHTNRAHHLNLCPKVVDFNPLLEYISRMY